MEPPLIYKTQLVILETAFEFLDHIHKVKLSLLHNFILESLEGIGQLRH